jgi:UDPglucose--hexose-1-phosphate uridylyltransferase
MPEFRRDPFGRGWVLVSSERRSRPLSFLRAEEPKETETCPFCPGNEEETPKEVHALRAKETDPDTPGWEVRVFPNRYPAVVPQGTFGSPKDSILGRASGVGVHEVIVETPVHDVSMADMETDRILLVLRTYARRIRTLKEDPRFAAILVFRNQGHLAGATKRHPHSQVIALPMVPERIEREIRAAIDYRAEQGSCIYCDLLHRALDEGSRIVHQSDDYVCFTPFASRVPYELTIYPREHESCFEAGPDDGLRALAETLKKTLGLLKRTLDDPPFNAVLHTSPNLDGPIGMERTSVREAFHWHIEVLPRLTSPAGFEWGTGVYINIVSPEDAAGHLRAE